MAVRKVYVGERDGPLWEAAERVAKQRDTSVSRLVVAALEDYLPRVVSEPDPSDRWAAIAPDAA